MHAPRRLAPGPAPLPARRFLRRRTGFVPPALEHRERRIAGEARIGVGAAAPEEGGAAPIGHRTYPAAGETETDGIVVRHWAEISRLGASGASPHAFLLEGGLYSFGLGVARRIPLSRIAGRSRSEER